MKRTPGIERRRENPNTLGRQVQNKKVGATGRKPPTGQDRTGHLSEPSANDTKKAGPAPEPMTYGLPKPDPAPPAGTGPLPDRFRTTKSGVRRIAEPR